ncbi:MAG: SH3 domain-containing protein [Lewinellaceae bacterium]|nr:SH3 domain-containing protein [Bacteroidota bacterium]MCB9314422.1 SH3 domain-containing protein [Lewinellaceae bacterium]
MKILITILLIFNFGISYSQDYKIGDNLFVNAYGGLNLRNEPNSKSIVIELLSYGDTVVVKAKSNEKEEVVINGMNGNWVEVFTDNNRGFAFDAYLTKLPIIEVNANPGEFCFFNVMNDYISNRIGIVDTTYYNNGSDGEGYHNMKIFQLKGGHQYIEHSYWESYEYEIQLNKIRDCEGIQLIKNLFQVCDKLSDESENKLTDIGSYHNIEIGESWYSILIRKFDDMFIIKIMGGP